MAKRFPVGTQAWLDHWLSREPRYSKGGTPYLTIKGHNVAVIEDHYQEGLWRYRIADPVGGQTWSEQKYSSADAAWEPALKKLAELLRSPQVVSPRERQTSS